MKRSFLLGIGIFAATSLLCAGQDVQFKTIDGVRHALNPAKPLKGTITLEVERTRTINPYDQSDVGMRMIRSSRDAAGNVILYDPNHAEGHRFDATGKYIGLVSKKGQGPGEFNAQQGYWIHFHDPGIWVFGGSKVAHFDASGAFLKEKSLKNRYSSGVDGSHYFSLPTSFDSQKKRTLSLKLIAFDMEGTKSAVDLLPAASIGMIVNPNGPGGLVEGWATPNYFYMADPLRQRIFCGLNLEYKIRMKDYAGKDLLIIERPYESVKIGRKDVEVLIGIAKQDFFKWIYDAFPDRLAAIKNVLALPKGYLGVFRITGPKKTELDIFDPEGRYLYAVVVPADLRIDDLQFFASGFGVMEQDGDYTVYREYRIKNLPEIFEK